MDRREAGVGAGVIVHHPCAGHAGAGLVRGTIESVNLSELLGRWRDPSFFALAAIALLLDAPIALDPFRLGLLAKYLCYAIVAVGIGLAWGKGGMLTLGQGVFFGLGGYSMGMYLKLHEAG